MIVVDGNDGTGKSTLVQSLRDLGYLVKDRGAPSKLTLAEPVECDPEDDYVILDAPIEVSRARLAKAGKDMDEEWHTEKSLIHFRQKFREVAAQLGVQVYDATKPAAVVLQDVINHLHLRGGEPSFLTGETNARYTHVGLPKGRLMEGTLALTQLTTLYPGLREHIAKQPRVLTWLAHEDSTYFYSLKPRSIPQMVALGLLDAGFCGTDLVYESLYEDQLDFKILSSENVRLCVVGHRGILKDPPKRPLTIASEYPNLASQWAHKRGLAHIVVQSYGSTEAYVPSLCDLALDVVETGATILANNLDILDEVCTSSLAVVVRRGSGMRHHKVCQ